jgi:DNA polymerase I-like protein with 3'-5' exonuclease and polymerase domains/uracil-DNA glycosylase
MTAPAFHIVQGQRAIGYEEFQSLTSCDACPLNVGAFRPVLGYGNLDARLVIVGEAPGKQEKMAGKPFIGKSGEVVDGVLKLLGSDRNDIYATNAVLCMPPEQEKIEKAERRAGQSGVSKSRQPGLKTNKAASTDIPALALKACHDRLKQEILRLPNRHVILVVGGTAAMAVTGKTGIMKLQGKVVWSEEYSCFVVFCFHPAFVLRSPGSYPDYRWAVKRALRLLNDPLTPTALDRPVTTYERIEDSSEAIKVLFDLMKAPAVSCDIECEGLDFLTDPILEVGFSKEPGHAYIFPGDMFLPAEVGVNFAQLALRKLLELHPLVIWHNGKFDIKFLRRWYGIRARVGADTMLLHYALDERSGGDSGSEGGGGGYGAHDLKSLAQKYCDAPIWDERLHEFLPKKNARFSMVPTPIRNQYHAYDCDYTLRLYYALLEEHKTQPPGDFTKGWPTPLDLHNKLLVRASNVLADIEYEGAHVDRGGLEEAHHKAQEQMAEIKRRAQILAEPWTFDLGGHVNIASTMQVQIVLYDLMGLPEQENPKTGHRTSDIEALLKLKSMAEGTYSRPLGMTEKVYLELQALAEKSRPFIEELIAYRELDKFDGTYLQGILKRLDATDTTHTEYKIHGTITGRLSSYNPNLQNVPRGRSVKEYFVPGPGWSFLNSDYKALEVRVACWYSRDEQLAADLRSADLHWQMAHNTFARIVNELEAAQDAHDMQRMLRLGEATGILRLAAADMRGKTDLTWETVFDRLKEEIRFHGKMVLFGWLYGRGPESSADPIHGINCTKKEAKEFITGLESRYPRLIEWKHETQELALTRGWIEGPTGRRRRFPFLSNQEYRAEVARLAVNTPIQGFASDLGVMAAVELQPQLVEKGWGSIILLVHDSIACKILDPFVEPAKDLVRKVMTTQLEDPLVDFLVDIGVGKSWALAH